MRSDVEDVLDDLFGNEDTLTLARQGHGIPAPLWRKLDDLGLPRVGAAHEHGGEGGDLIDFCDIARSAGYAAAPVPLVETMLAASTLATAGVRIPGGTMSIGPVVEGEVVRVVRAGDRWRATGSLTRIPWGDEVECLVLCAVDDQANEYVLLLERGQWVSTRRLNLADEPRSDVQIDVELAERPAPLPAGGAERLRLLGAFGRATMMSGALRRVSEMTVAYARQRSQFGRPIATFQAVKSHLVVIAGQARLADETARAAARRSIDGVLEFEAAVASSVVRRCSRIGVPLAHQVHAAMGMTLESDLQIFTRRLHAWRQEFGTEQQWNIAVGEFVRSRDAGGAWDLITTGAQHG